MTVSEFYAQIGGDYDQMSAKFHTDDRIMRFLSMFLRDTSFEQLKEALSSNDTAGAFSAAHTLKGVAMNLSFTDLAKQSGDITELLRSQNLAAAQNMFSHVESAYDKIAQLLPRISL